MKSVTHHCQGFGELRYRPHTYVYFQKSNRIPIYDYFLSERIFAILCVKTFCSMAKIAILAKKVFT